VDLADLPAYLEALQKAAEDAMPAAANAMASSFKYQVQNVALNQVHHGPGMFWKAAPSRPPARVTGFLAASMFMTPALGGGASATALVGITAKYAWLQEDGGDTWPNKGTYMHWKNTRGPWWKKRVHVPAHPYWRPTRDRMIRNGDLTREASTAFWVRVLPYFRG
jgi:hypothetical protein